MNRLPAIAGRLLLAALIWPVPACGGAPPGPAPEAEDQVEHLRSLGYVSWDEDADESLSGITVHDPERAYPGYNLYTNDVDRVILADMDGRQVHEWRLPEGKKQCEYAELLPDEAVIVECVDQSLTYVSMDSRTLWDLELPVHHDVARIVFGDFVVPFLENKPYAGRDVGFDGLAHIARDGRARKIWSSFDRMDELRRFHRPSPLDTPPGADGDPLAGREEGFEYYHLNSVTFLPDTPLGRRDPRFKADGFLICLRNVNLIAVLSPGDLSVTWAWGEDELDLPHRPVMLESGNILLFDNGTKRGWSRVLEIRPPGGEIVWSYEGTPREAFFSKWRGSAQRLPNGNTLITESEKGHVFEVTPLKEIVWEMWNPEIVDGRRKRIYRMTRLAPEEVSSALLSKEPPE